MDVVLIVEAMTNEFVRAFGTLSRMAGMMLGLTVKVRESIIDSRTLKTKSIQRALSCFPGFLITSDLKVMGVLRQYL